MLFLDVDGVVKPSEAGPEIPLAQLKRIVEATKCHIVLSSDWRLYDELPAVEAAMRSEFGYDGPKLYGATPDLQGPPRGLEIAAWLASQLEPADSWAVVDDRDELDFVRHRAVLTNPKLGLDEVAADRLIELLNS